VRGGTCLKLFLQLAYCLVARLDTALAHLFPIDVTGPQDNGPIQYKKSNAGLGLAVLVKGVREHGHGADSRARRTLIHDHSC
jgi:hypothetical protein